MGQIKKVGIDYGKLEKVGIDGQLTLKIITTMNNNDANHWMAIQ